MREPVAGVGGDRAVLGPAAVAVLAALAAGVLAALGPAALAAERPEASRPAEQGAARADRFAAVLRVGQQAPDFELPRLALETDADGQTVGRVGQDKVRLSKVLGKKPVCLLLSSYT